MSFTRKLQREMRRVPRAISSSVFEKDLSIWDHYGAEAADGEFLAGPEPSLPDFTLWPVLHTLVREGGSDILDSHRHLKQFYETFAARESVKKVSAEAAAKPDPDTSQVKTDLAETS